MSTIREKLAAMDGDRVKREQRAAVERAVLEALADSLPETLPAPTISNEETTVFGKPAAWLSWRAPYAYEKNALTGSQILQALESAGFLPLPLTLCKWDDWRRTPEPGYQEDIPETKGRHTLKDTEPIAPLWIEPNQHTGTEARAMYERDGRIYKVTVTGPAGCAITARKHETRGGWYFESGTARLIYPEHWHSLAGPTGEIVAGISAQARAYRDTEQGLSGAIYFEPMTEHDEFPLTPGQFLAVLERGKDAR